MARVQCSIPIADGASVYVTRDVESFGVTIGDWYVALASGKLYVSRAGGYDPHPILVVDAALPAEETTT